MPDSDFLNFLLDQLAGLPDVTAKRMFGGHGLYQRDAFFAIVFRDELYFKVSDQSRPRYESAGMKPFAPTPKQTLRSYYEVPADVLENRDRLTEWAMEAVAAQSATSKRSARPKAKVKRRKSHAKKQ